MKKYIFSVIALTTLLFAACKKDKNNGPNGGKGDTYQPFSAGSVWKYRETSTVLGETYVDTTVNTMTAQTVTVNGKKYSIATSIDSDDTTQSRIGLNNNVYSTLMVDEVAGGVLEYEYLDDRKAVNEFWQKDFQIEDDEEVYDARLKTTILEKGITKNILGTNFNNVIHTKVELFFKVNNNYVSISHLDFYIAKGIGIVGIYSTAQGNVVFKSELFNYNIK